MFRPVPILLLLFLTLAKVGFSQSVNSTPALFGNWRGSVYQPGVGTYIAQLSLHDTNGTVEYLSLGCGGTVAMLNNSGNVYQYAEHFTYGNDAAGGRCIDDGIITAKVQGDSMDFETSGQLQGRTYTAKGVLARQPENHANTPVHISGDSLAQPGIFQFPIVPQNGAPVELITETGGLSSDAGTPVTPCGRAEPYDDPCHHKKTAYYALDFDSTDAHVVAAGSGEIVSIKIDGDYPRVIIKHGDGYFTEYGEFLISPDLLEGPVEVGKKLGKLKKVNERPNHLHFQVKYDPHGNGQGKELSQKSVSELATVTLAGLKLTDYKLKRSSTKQVKILGRFEKMPLPTILIHAKDGGTVLVQDFYQNTQTRVLDKEMEAVIIDNRNYQILFYRYGQDCSFLISLSEGDLRKLRAASEQEFLKVLNITKDQACQLMVSIGVAPEVSEKAAGKIYRLSFCPNGKPMPY